MTWFGDAGPSGPGDNLMPLWVAGEVKGHWYLPLIFDTRKSFFFFFFLSCFSRWVENETATSLLV